MKVRNIRRLTVDSLIALVVFFIFVGIADSFFKSSYADKQKIHLENELRRAQLQYDVVLQGYKNQATILFMHALNTEETQKIMYQALHANAQERTLLRQKLFKTYKELYTHMVHNNVRQLHFHLPGAISFLRMHRPEKFGDDLTNIRPTVVQAAKWGTSVHAYEEGRALNGFRNVFPILYRGKVCGTVEVSYNFDAIREASMKLDDTVYELIIKNEVYDRKAWVSEKVRYKRSLLSARFASDDSVDKPYKGSMLSKDEIEEVSKKLSPDIVQDLSEGEDFSRVVSYADNYYVVSFHAIKNIKKKTVAYFVVYHRDAIFKRLVQNSRNSQRFIYLGSFAFMLLTFFYIRLLRSYNERKRDSGNDAIPFDPFNKSIFETTFERMIMQSHMSARPLSVILFDVDHFRMINDKYGRKYGDKLVKKLLETVQEVLRKSDILARWDGNEAFMVLLADTSNENGVKIAQKIRKALNDTPFEKGEVSCSFGVATLEDAETKESMLNRLNALLFKAKAKGRDRVES